MRGSSRVGRRRAPNRGRRMATPACGGAAHGRDRASAASRRRSARRRSRDHAPDLRARRLEDGQPRQSSRRPDHPPRLGRPRACARMLRPHVVPRAQPPPPPAEQGGDDRRLPRRARAPRHRHEHVVGSAARARAPRRRRPVRLGEGERRARRDRVVGGACRRGGAASPVRTTTPAAAPRARWPSPCRRPRTCSRSRDRHHGDGARRSSSPPSGHRWPPPGARGCSRCH